MNFKKIREIIKFDVQKSIQNKWFVILNILMFVAILFATNWNNISNYLNEHNVDFMTEEEITIQILDNENLVYDKFNEKYGESSNFNIERVDTNTYSKENIPADNVILLEVKSSPEDIITAKIVSKEGIDNDIYNLIYDELSEVRANLFATNNGVSIDELNILNEEVQIERELLGVDAENSETKEIIKTISIVVVYMVLIIILSRIANEIAQEKVSKSIEYVLTSVTAGEYLISKVLSVTIATLIQVLYTFVYYIIGNSINSLFVMQSTGASFGSSFINIDTSIASYILVMAAYLIFTVFLTALIQATLTSKTTSVAEAGNTTMILLFLIVILYLVSLSAISPYITVTPLMYIISCIPIVSTFFVPAMMIIGQATTLQIIISFIVLIMSVPFIFKFCSKRFKNGILDYTSSNKKKKVKKELTLKEKQEKDLKASIAKKIGFTIGIALILLVFLQTILAYIFGIILPKFINTDINTLNIILNGLVSCVSLGIVTLYIYSNIKDKEEVKTISGKKAFEITFVGIALIAIVQVALSWIYSKIGLNYDIFNELSVVPSNTLISNILYLIAIVVIPAIFEELLFRKAIINYSKKYGKAFAVIFSAILFGLFHMNLNQGIFAFLIGIIFGIIAIQTSSIKLTVLLHFLNNLYAALQVILSGFALEMFNNIILAVIIFAIIILIKTLPKVRNIKREDLKIDKDCLLIFKNYTFIISMILLIVMFIVTENFLRV